MENNELSLAIHLDKDDMPQEEEEEILPKWFLGVEEKPEVPAELVEIDEKLCFIRKVHREAPGALRQIFRCLEPIDRLRSEGVCKFWKSTLWEVYMGKKSGVKELSYEAITNGRFQKSKITDRHMIALYKRFGKNAEVFNLPSFISIDLNDRACWELPTFSPELFKFFHLLPNLVSMDLSYDGIYQEDFKNAESLVQIGDMHRLKRLKIGSFWNQTTEGFRKFLSKCPQLIDLEIAWVDHEQLDVISELCPHLESLTFTDFELLENDRLNNFFRKLKKLKKIVFRSYWRQRSLDFEGIAALPDLEHLEVDGLLLTETGLRTLTNGGSKLQKLVLTYPKLHNPALQMIGDLNTLKKLEMYECKTNGETLIAIARQGKLEELIIPNCKKLTDSVIIQVIRSNKSLVLLNIFGCLRVSNKTLRAVVKELKRRYGNPPRKLPNGKDDPRIFRLICGNTSISWGVVEEATRKNPWLRVSYWQ